MSAKKPKHVDRVVDRHGHVRYYFRRRHGRRTPLPSEPGTLEFVAAYEKVLNAERRLSEQRMRGAPELKVLLHFAIDNGWRTDDPTIRIKKFAEGEFHTWTDVEIEKFEQRWPIGSRERLAFALFLYTGQRASDVAKMSWSEVSDDGIWVSSARPKPSSSCHCTLSCTTSSLSLNVAKGASCRRVSVVSLRPRGSAILWPSGSASLACRTVA